MISTFPWRWRFLEAESPSKFVDSDRVNDLQEMKLDEVIA